MKRAFDILVALLGLIVLAPLMAVIAVVVHFSSPGGAIFCQARVGRGEKPFICYKFRTMTVGAPSVGTHDISPGWVNPVGRILRATKLDELPQLFNVLRGEMSLVGPRPCLPSQTVLIAERRKKGVFAARPGITGAAQIAGLDMSTPVALAEVDRQYIECQSFAGDLGIILRTLLHRRRVEAAQA